MPDLHVTEARSEQHGAPPGCQGAVAYHAVSVTVSCDGWERGGKGVGNIEQSMQSAYLTCASKARDLHDPEIRFSNFCVFVLYNWCESDIVMG